MIYLDYQATTPCDKRVFEAMAPYFCNIFGNPHSQSHQYGWESSAAVEQAREKIASVISATPQEIIFTSGATESNNLALIGATRLYQEKKHIITFNTEHKCVLSTCKYLESQGIDVTYLPVMSDGLVDIRILEQAIRKDTLMVSILAVNNEIGVIQNLYEIGALCRSKGVLLHTDAAQGFGKIPMNVDDMNIDLLSISGHKIYGPKGIGALYVRRKPKVRLSPIIHGGGQERGMRSGTLPLPLCVGLGEASLMCKEIMTDEHNRIKGFRDYMYDNIMKNLSHVYVNGSMTHRIAGNLNMSFACVEGESLMMGIKDIAVSSGSACTSSSLEPSYVLKALGVKEELAHTSIRISIGRYTTSDEIEYATSAIIKAVNRLRAMSPIWDMMNDGIDLSTIKWDSH